ncbi:hypothetical protein QMG61_13225 [Cryobacterium sp. PH31-AA6]|uniref:hypothetical protein n=1 Tax=Cryobacterium sp. PH31-AA6 TaxID=3046205 RepID=UPI0024B8B16E|nr:hypothetical protein [Cryobacterium sp. PH31-AA6]MDJ0324719.1 hypothetical protein [Cryobacterium sp. PH31-AA6]
MTVRNRTGTWGAVLALLLSAATVTLSGCAHGDPTPQVLAFLATDRTAEDALPADLDLEGPGDLVGDSSRLVGLEAGISYFVGTSKSAQICLILLAEPQHIVGYTCGPVNRLEVSISGQGSVPARVPVSAYGAARFLGGADQVPDGWMRLNDFLIVRRG